MTTPRTRKEESHERIVEAAARAVRRHGYAGVGVAEVMKDAGLTHGGFYAHFDSRDALLVAAVDHAAATSAASITARRETARESGHSAFRTFVDGYLSERLLTATDAGCPIAALCAEMPRQASDVRAAATRRVDALIGYVARICPSLPAAEAGVVAATLVGSLQIARAFGDVAAGKALLAATRASLLERHDR